jgi:integrase
MKYKLNKGFNPGHQEKTDRQKFLTVDDLKRILSTVDAGGGDKRVRDHGAIFLGFYLALRVGEVPLLTRNCFRHMRDEVIYVPTLKQAEKIPIKCKECGKKVRVSSNRMGSDHHCSKCGNTQRIPVSKKLKDKGPPEIAPPDVDPHVIVYCREYLKKMRPEQEILFESRKGKPISPRMLSYIFGHYAIEAGIDPEFSWHSLRHGRGCQIWQLERDQAYVRDMLRQRSLGASEFYVHLDPTQRAKRRAKLEALK